LATEEKRRHRRIEVRWPISVLSQDGMIGGETRNISVDGVLLWSEKPLRADETLFISLRPPNHQAIEVTGKVIWSDLYGIDDQGTVRCMGICFVKISDIDRDFLDDLVSSHLDR
jgi:hypothetical protein